MKGVPRTDSVKTKHAKVNCTALKTNDIHISIRCSLCLMGTSKSYHTNTVIKNSPNPPFVVAESRPQPNRRAVNLKITIHTGYL